MPNKLSQFWQELKRRNVTRVLAVYIAAAFMLLELVDMISEPFGLPDLSMKVGFFVLLGGLIIVFIVSWLYDIHPEGGIVKSESVDKVTAEEIPKSSSSWKIASYISFVVIVGLIVLNVIPRSGKKEILDKSIAVLPFRNDSPDQEMYFINGTMEEILDNLSKIKDLRVVSRNSVEQYRDQPKPTPVIAEEMNVSYILEGSGQRDGNNIRLTVQLLDARKDLHIWSESYYKEVKNIFELQSEIAILVAGEIDAVITPEEKQRLEYIPTTNNTAHDFYLQGKDQYERFFIEFDKDHLKKAKRLYNKSLQNDSLFAQAYLGLAKVYWQENVVREIQSENLLDSVLILIDKTLSINNQLAEAYCLRGRFYSFSGEPEEALKEFDMALEINPNSPDAYYEKGNLFYETDYVKSLYNFQKATKLNRKIEPSIAGLDLPNILRNIGEVYGQAGFLEKQQNCIKQAFELDEDSVEYFSSISLPEMDMGNYGLALELQKKAYKIDSTHLWNLLYIASSYQMLGDYTESLKYYKMFIERCETIGIATDVATYQLAYVYWKNGLQQEADYYFDKTLEFSGNIIENGYVSSIHYQYYLEIAGIYAFRGEKRKVYENLKKFNQKKIMPYWVTRDIMGDSLFNSIRDEPEFQQIIMDVVAKYQAEHERVRQWLEENDML